YVHPIQVEVIQLEAAQRRLQRTIDVFASVAARVGIAFLRIEAELAGDHQLVAQTDIGDEAPQYLFGLSAGVHIGAVQHVAATFDIAIEDAARFGVVRSPSVVAKRHRSQRKRTDPQPRTSQRYVFIQLHEEFIPPLETSDGSMMQTIHYPLSTNHFLFVPQALHWIELGGARGWHGAEQHSDQRRYQHCDDDRQARNWNTIVGQQAHGNGQRHAN